ncbi:MAG TPA: amidase family protein [Acidimicrobiales bacterium]|nr:amidase family protein [Acidimicrobiales bacterium]
MPSDDVLTWTAGRLAGAVRRREIASRELLSLALDRIDRINPKLNAVVTLDAERAGLQAATADEATAHGETIGPLHGLPITVKDALETAGLRSTGGAVELTDHAPAADASAVARLRAAGAVVFGKTNVPRWSGDLQTYNEIFGTTNNPWDPARVPGGSSGGAAAAVAAGLTSFELGTDIGGSVRIPAHCCGVFGLKTTYGIVPQRGYLDRVGGGVADSDINVLGPLARSAQDLDLLLDVVAGPLEEDAVGWRLELPAPKATSLADYRVGVWLDEPSVPLGAEVRAAARGAVDVLADAGARVEEAHPGVAFDEQVTLFMEAVGAAVSPGMDPALGEVVAGGHLNWLHALDRRAGLRRAWADWFDSYDLLLCPVIPVEAFPHNQQGDFIDRTVDIDGVDHPYPSLISWTGLVGIMGLPSAVPPIGFTATTGMPVGLQVVAPWYHDREAIVAAGLLADACGVGYRVPPLD